MSTEIIQAPILDSLLYKNNYILFSIYTENLINYIISREFFFYKNSDIIFAKIDYLKFIMTNSLVPWSLTYYFKEIGYQYKSQFVSRLWLIYHWYKNLIYLWLKLLLYLHIYNDYFRANSIYFCSIVQNNRKFNSTTTWVLKNI